tara:strand:- start:1486 stop:2184 length:699 start_codon:yes stop_codon:yes gene_type:complete
LSELKRINSVYDNYLSKKNLSKKWSHLNEGNKYIEKEISTLIKSQLEFYSIDIKNKNILDIGCAGGGTIKLLKKMGSLEKNISGIDIREDRLVQTKEIYPAVKIQHMDARNLKFDDNQFDLVSTFTVFSSILESGHRKKISNEINRVLKPGGIILYYDLRYNNPLNRNVLGIKRNEIDTLFPNMVKNIRLITLFPHLARRLGNFTKSFYPFLSKYKILRTHYAGLIIKADNY